MGHLDSRAMERIGGPSWQELRAMFLAASEELLSVSENARGVLTTIYVKYSVSSTPDANVFAVIWLKSSRQLVIGLALPDDVDDPLFVKAPSGMSYKGLKKYLVVRPGDSLPPQFHDWVQAAYRASLAAK